MKIGIVGLGRMGAAMSERLRELGFDVLGWDRDEEKNRAAAARGVAIAANPRAVAAAAEAVISSITEDNGARTIFGAAGGFLEADVAGKLFIEMSTLQPMTGRALLPLVEAKGAQLIDAPVLGTIAHARAGTLLAMVGGGAAVLERARPILGKLTSRIVPMGPNGAGYAMKLAVNLGLGAYIEALAESLALGLQQGLDLDTMLDVLQGAPYASGWLKSKIPVLRGAASDVSLDIRTLRKDIMSAVATGALAGVPMPLTAGTLASLSAAVGSGYGDRDLAELPKFLREAMLQNFK